MMPRPFLSLMVLSVALAALLSTPVQAQTENDARLGGGSDIPQGVTVRLPQGGVLPPVHVISADNPSDESIEVEFRVDAPVGIVVEPEWEEKAIPAQGSVANPFSVRVGPGMASGEYPVVVQLVRSDIESQPGRITTLPAIQAAFTVEVTGEAATVTVRSVSAHSGDPVPATITLSARHGDSQWFEIDRTEGATLESRVAPGEFRAAVLLGDREVAAEEFTVEADEALELVIEVETASFVVTAVRPVEERGRLVVVDLVASVNNEIGPIPGRSLLQATVSHNGVEVDVVTLDEFEEVPGGITEAAATYRPDAGWQEGTYQVTFELVTPEFTLTAPDPHFLEVPAMGFDLLGLLDGLDVRQVIGLVAAALLGLLLVDRLIRFFVRRRRRRQDRAPRKQRRAQRSEARRARRSRRSRRKDRTQPAVERQPSWLEERIGPATSHRTRWDDDTTENVTHPISAPAPEPTPPPTGFVDSPGAHLAPEERRVPDPAPPASTPSSSTPSESTPSPWVPSDSTPSPTTPFDPTPPAPPASTPSSSTPSDSTPSPWVPPASAPSSASTPSAASAAQAAAAGGLSQMVEAMRVIQRLHDQGNLAPGWSITDATLTYWAMTSPRVQEELHSVGMAEEEYLTAIRRLFAQGLLARGHISRDSLER